MRTILITAILLTTALAGCTAAGQDSLRIAFVAKDTATAPHEALDELAAFVAQQTGQETEVVFFTSSTSALEAVRFGQADVASVDGAAAWLAWTQNDLQAIASEIRGDGRTHYLAAAWVRADSEIQTVADFQGQTSCHTGATKSAGMMLPVSYLIREGLLDATGYSDVSQMPDMARAFFDEPVIGGAYEGYNGALRCLSEGVGDIAFIRDTTPADYCMDDPEPWCLPLSEYRMIVAFGEVPEHPFMVSPGLPTTVQDEIRAALLALNDSDQGREILADTFGTGGIQAVTTEEHLGGYGALIQHIPGITAYAKSK